MKKKGGHKTWNDDLYTRLAKQKGYPARSVFKLEEIQKKFSIIKTNDSILDIGSAPGSWTLYASQIIKKSGKIVGIDINPPDKAISIGSPYQFIRGNIFDDDSFDKMIKSGPYSLILSDAAPSTTGDSLVDTARSYDLAIRILAIAGESLQKNGNLVIKIFQGGDSADILSRMKKLFASVKAYKPSATRKKSIETYYIGFNYGNP
ncbi:MAG: RlmE family RNA methyltransferase [Spirochaetales bacterium]|nr:RlmE family RNA methyltransferase [Spirochaetales bacterium]